MVHHLHSVHLELVDCTGFTPVNNTGGSHAVAAGRQYSRNTDSTVTSNTLTDFGPGDSETVTGFVNAVGVGTTTLTVGVNNGTFDKLVISNNEDAQILQEIQVLHHSSMKFMMQDY